MHKNTQTKEGCMNKIIMSSLLLVATVASAKMEWSPERIEQANRLFKKWSVEFGHMASDKVDATAEGATKLEDNNWGDVFFGKNDRIEFSRSMQATLLFQDCANDDRAIAYNLFTEGQNPALKITPAQFDDIYFKIQELKKHINLDALEGMIVMNDLTKFHDVQHKIERISGKTFADHDDALLELLELAETNQEAAKIIPNFMKLEEKDRTFIRSVWKARLNIAQFVQGECQEIALQKFAALNPEQKLAGFLEVFCDVAGAGAHTGAKCIMNKFVYAPYMLAYEALNKSNDTHEINTWYYAQRLEKAGVAVPENLTENEILALAKLFCMRRGSNAQQFQEVHNAFNKLDDAVQKSLVEELTIRPGKIPSITVMYSPIFMQNATADNLDSFLLKLHQYFEFTRNNLLPKNFTFNIRNAAKKTVLINELLNHPIYYEQKGQGAELLLVEPTKEKNSDIARFIGYLSNKLNWIKDKFGAKSKV